MKRKHIPTIKFVKASDQALIDQRRDQRLALARSRRTITRRFGMDIPDVVVGKMLIRLCLSLVKKPLLDKCKVAEGSSCKSAIGGKFYLAYTYVDHRGYIVNMKINVLKHCKFITNIGHARAHLRSILSASVRMHNKLRTESHIRKPISFTRKQMATSQILKRHYGKAARVLDRAIYECRAVQTYIFFFPELWDDYLCSRVGISSDAHTKRCVGSFMRINTVAEYIGDLKTAYENLPELFISFRKSDFSTARKRLQRSYYNGFWERAIRGFRDPRTDPDVTCLFNDKWPISVTAGEWRLDKEEYDILLPSRTTGSVHAK